MVIDDARARAGRFDDIQNAQKPWSDRQGPRGGRPSDALAKECGLALKDRRRICGGARIRANVRDLAVGKRGRKWPKRSFSTRAGYQEEIRARVHRSRQHVVRELFGSRIAKCSTAAVRSKRAPTIPRTCAG